MNINLRKIKNTPVKLVEFEGNIIGCFYYGDRFVAKEDFDDRIWAFVGGKDSAEGVERQIPNDSSNNGYVVPSGDYGSGQ